MASAPFEIIAAPFTVYTAPVGEVFPLINAAPAGNWAKLGTSGDANYAEDGPQVSHPQTVVYHRVAGRTAPVKATRTGEDLMVTVTLFDLALEQYTKIIGNVAVTVNPPASGIAGFREIDLHRGLSMAEFAVLVRGVSPYGAGASADFNMQYQVYRTVVDSSPTVVLRKGDPPAGLLFTFTALWDATAGQLARLLAQDADPT